MYKRRRRVLFVLPSLVGGGAEKVLIDIINFLSPDQYEMHLAVFENKGFYVSAVPAYVKVYDLKKKNRLSWLRIPFALANLEYRVRPDSILCIGSLASMIALVSRLFVYFRVRLIISVHGNISLSTRHNKLGNIRILLYRCLFGLADCCLATSEGVRQDVIKLTGVNHGLVKTQYNPLDLVRIKKLMLEPVEELGEGKYILAVGRLHIQKNYPLLIEAFARISSKVIERLVILGAGEEETRLRVLAVDLKVSERVVFMGFQPNPYKFMKNASAFVLSSRWESFALVVAEAMACGTPVVSTDCPSGPGEIITHGVNGLLVPVDDAQALANAILELLNNTSLRERFVASGFNRAQDFGVDRIKPQYEDILS